MNRTRYIETDEFDFEFLSKLGERESWRKEIHRPIYHVHKWWAKRLGSVFRGILLGSILPSKSDLTESFYAQHDLKATSVFDPFMGSGTTVGEAHKLGMEAYGRDINPVAAEAVRVAFSDIDKDALIRAFEKLEGSVANEIRSLYKTKDKEGRVADVLYYFWVMQTTCVSCTNEIDLFSSWILAKNAYPQRKPEVRIICPGCGDIFTGLHNSDLESCPKCALQFNPKQGPCKGGKVECAKCNAVFSIVDSMKSDAGPPNYRLYAKLVLTASGSKEYLPASTEDLKAYELARKNLSASLKKGSIALPKDSLAAGYNTNQAVKYGFKEWIDFFNDRQLLALGLLQKAISEIEDQSVRDALLILFSGTLEFNNRFASYKGEGTGAVRHMFSHHILKPERLPIEANVWGTSKSSGSFSTLFKSRLLRAVDYKKNPIEIGEDASRPLPLLDGHDTGSVDNTWGSSIHLTCGDSGKTSFADQSMDIVVTDPPFFDNVHYSELADFFFTWQTLVPRGFIKDASTTRSIDEVQDTNADDFARKLEGVFTECYRVLRNDGLLVFTYHHSRREGWDSIASAILQAGFVVVNSHPVKAEMSVATPKVQAKDPIQLDIILVCRKGIAVSQNKPLEKSVTEAANLKIKRMEQCGFTLSANDEKVIRYGQALTLLRKQEISVENVSISDVATSSVAVASGI